MADALDVVAGAQLASQVLTFLGDVAGEAGSQPGVGEGSVTGPMMGVASLRERPTHGPTGTRVRTERGSRMVLGWGGAGRAAVRQLLDKVVDVPVFVVVLGTVEVPQLQFVVLYDLVSGSLFLGVACGIQNIGFFGR